jgi:hypothetical protein
MTLINHDLVSPFLSPNASGVVEEGPRRPFDGSADGMRRLRDPFAVNPAGTQAATTDDEPNGHSQIRQG